MDNDNHIDTADEDNDDSDKEAREDVKCFSEV